MIKKFKNLLGKLYIAQLKNKNIVVINLNKKELIFLDFLWVEGFIYSYFCLKKNIFKVCLKNLFVFKNLIFYNKFLSWRDLKNLNSLEKNSTFFIFNDKGLFTSKLCLKLGLGGFLICRI